MCRRWWLIQKSNTGQRAESTLQGSAQPPVVHPYHAPYSKLKEHLMKEGEKTGRARGLGGLEQKSPLDMTGPLRP